MTYTLRNGGAVAEIVPERGGLITRFAVNGDEVFYLDRATLDDITKNVRGGVPILFPCAGKPPAGWPMKQHGFARNFPFRCMGVDDSRLAMELASTPATLETFPFDFRLALSVELETDSLALRITVENTGLERMPVHFGLHPYFALPLAAKAGTRIPTAATRAFDNTTGAMVAYQTPDFGEGEIDLHLLDHGSHAATLGNRRIEWDAFLPVLVLWTQPEKPFLCVEPWSALAGELAHPQRWLTPGASTGGVFRVTVSQT